MKYFSHRKAIDCFFVECWGINGKQYSWVVKVPNWSYRKTVRVSGLAGQIRRGWCEAPSESDLPCQTTHEYGFPFIPQHSTKKPSIAFLWLKYCKNVIVTEQCQTDWYGQAYQTVQTRRYRDWYGSCWGITGYPSLRSELKHPEIL